MLQGERDTTVAQWQSVQVSVVTGIDTQGLQGERDATMAREVATEERRDWVQEEMAQL